MSTTTTSPVAEIDESAGVSTAAEVSPDAVKPKRRWWAYKRTWFLGLPLFLVLAVAGLFIWGEMQPRPPGFAPTAPEAGAIITDQWAQFTVDVDTGSDYALFDLNEGRMVTGDFTTPGWDLAFKKTTILTNSGVTNPEGPGGAASLGEVALVDAVVPDPIELTSDLLGGDDDDKLENPALSGWYNYDFLRHIINARDKTFFVRTDGDRDALIHFDSYYCEDESTRCLTLRYRLVPKADTVAAITEESALG